MSVIPMHDDIFTEYLSLASGGALSKGVIHYILFFTA